LSYFSGKRDLTLFRRRLRRIRKMMDIRSNNKDKNNNMVLGGQCTKISKILSICTWLSFVTDEVYYCVSTIGFRFHNQASWPVPDQDHRHFTGCPLYIVPEHVRLIAKET
jgi:hypothetical protein